MTLDILLICSAFITSLVCGFIAIPLILNYCKAKGLYDIPNSRKIHTNKIPRLGGLSFLPSLTIAILIALFVLDNQFQPQKIQINLWSLYFIISLIMIYSVGIIDDLTGLSANIKFVVQVVAASLLPVAGLYINNLYGIFGIHEIPFWIGAPLTVLTIVFIDNAMNLIDGIDGLCAGLSFLTLSGFLYCFWYENLIVYCIVIAGLAGVLVPYLYFNIFGKIENNTKIFMGDSGSLTLGFIIGFLVIKYIMNNAYVMPFENDRLLIAISFIIVPTFDVVRVVLHRLKNHRSIFEADRHHIHHKLMKAGLSMHQTLMVILAIAISYIFINILLYEYTNINVVLIADIAIYTAIHISINKIIHYKLKEEHIA